MNWMINKPQIFNYLILSCAVILLLPLFGGAGQWSKMVGSDAQAADQGWFEQEAKFYKGKIVRVFVSTTPGGGHDNYARLYASNLPRFLSGARALVINAPGAGQIIGHNKVYESKPDGLTMGSINRGMMFNQLIGTRGIRFDFTKFTWLANMAAEPRIFVVGASSKFQSLEDIGKGGEEIKIGSTGQGTMSYTDTKLIAKIFNWPVNQVAGYPGSAGTLLAAIKGEVDGTIGIYDTIQGAINSGDVKPILQMGGRRVAGLENIPLIEEVVTDPKWNDLLRLLKIQYAVGRLVAAPPGIPETRIKFLREVFHRMAYDKKFLDMAGKRNLAIDFTPGIELEGWIKDALRQPPEMVDLLKGLIAGTE